MSKLPQTEDPPQAREGYDPARVEDAFAAFASRVRELEAVAAELRAELHALRAERSAPLRFDDEVWPVESDRGFAAPDWIAAVPPPFQRASAVPRVALEGAFLLLIGLFAGLADLSVAWILAVMAVAWGLVAIAEWAAAAKRSQWRLDEVAPPIGEAADTTGPWDTPVVEATVVEAAPDPESKTVVARLPAPELPADPEESAPEAEAAGEPEPEPAPKRRRFRRSKQPAEAGAADPWEA